MTFPSHTPDHDAHGSDDARSNHQAAERCLLYLLGELTAEQANAFERDLEHSEQLRKKLVWHSNLLCDVADARPTVHLERAGTYRWGVVATIAAIAACLTIAFLPWLGGNERGGVSLADSSTDSLSTADAQLANAAPEALLIAQAWAEGPLSEEGVLSDLETDRRDGFGDVDVTLFSDDGDDLSLSWLVAAAEAGVITDG